MEKSHDLDDSQWNHLIDWMKRVLDKLTVKYKNVTKGVDELMGGYILHTRTDDILDQGAEKYKRDLIADMIRRGKKPEEISDFCNIPIEFVKEVEKSLPAMV